MADLNPILLLPYSQSEFTRKLGGGRTPEPIAEVTPALRTRLVDALEAIAADALAARASASDPLPVKVSLHEKALAKSNRPYRLLSAAALPAVAAAAPGQLIVEGTPDRMKGLASSIKTGTSKPDLYAISTFSSFAAWSLDRDVFGVDDAEAAQEVLDSARAEGHFLKITFFPWVSRAVRRLSAPQGAISSGHDNGDRASLIDAYSATIGLPVHTANYSETRPVVYIESANAPTLGQVRAVKGIRSVSIAPEYVPIDTSTQSYVEIRRLDGSEWSAPSADAPLVGVLDSGVDSDILEPSVERHETFNAPGDRDPWHGTFVAGLIAGSAPLNDNDSRFPTDAARILDAEVMPAGRIAEPLLFQRISEAVDGAREVKVWNCSFGANPWGEPDYGTFAQDLDALSDERGLLFVQAAGNYGPPGRSWPPVTTVLDDSLSSPAEAVRSLTVGARAHRGGYVPEGAPSSYSRRGPNFALHVKPDLCHWAGDVGPDEVLSGYGIQSVVPSGHLAESVGTSFSTPIVSAIASNVWARLDEAAATPPSPELVKGLLVHAAILSGEPIDAEHRHYYGWGVPPQSSAVLANDEFTFTTVSEVVLTPGSDWYKRPFPVPEPLLTSEGKFRGEVILTLSYAPPINSAFGAEAIRYDVAGAFGSFEVARDGKEHFRSITPQEVVGANWEADQVADGKWSPLKSHRARYPSGKKGGQWALRLSLTERVSEEVQLEQRVYAILTFRALSDEVAIYNSGRAKIDDLGYVSKAMIASNRISVTG